jgi:acylphosphatase
MQATDIKAHVIVSGRVQGVFFRAETQSAARRLGVTGWVRNLPDRTVEAVFEGPRPQVEAAVQWCHTGSPGARVTDVQVAWEAASGEFADLSVRY